MCNFFNVCVHIHVRGCVHSSHKVRSGMLTPERTGLGNQLICILLWGYLSALANYVYYGIRNKEPSHNEVSLTLSNRHNVAKLRNANTYSIVLITWHTLFLLRDTNASTYTHFHCGIRHQLLYIRNVHKYIHGIIQSNYSHILFARMHT